MLWLFKCVYADILVPWVLSAKGWSAPLGEFLQMGWTLQWKRAIEWWGEITELCEPLSDSQDSRMKLILLYLHWTSISKALMCNLVLSWLYWRSHSNSARKPKRSQEASREQFGNWEITSEGFRDHFFFYFLGKSQVTPKALVLWKKTKKQINRLFMCPFACGSHTHGNLHKGFIFLQSVHCSLRDRGCPWYKCG